MLEADIVPNAVYQTVISGRYGAVERMVAKLEPRRFGMLVFYRVRRDGIISDITYTMALDRFAKSVLKRLS